MTVGLYFRTLDPTAENFLSVSHIVDVVQLRRHLLAFRISTSPPHLIDGSMMEARCCVTIANLTKRLISGGDADHQVRPETQPKRAGVNELGGSVTRVQAG